MKRLNIMFARAGIIVVLFSMINLVVAQSASEMPEYIGNFVAKSPSGVVQLERLLPKADNRVSLLGATFGVGRSNVGIAFNGEKSPVRFRSDQTIEFYLRVGSQAIDPTTLVQLFRAKSEKGKRRVEIGSVSNLTLQDESTLNSSAVPFSAKKVGTEFFVIRPSSPLPPGEYVLSTTDQNDGFLFGIDTE